METNLLGGHASVCRDGAPGYTLSVEDGKVFNSGDVNGTYWFTTSCADVPEDRLKEPPCIDPDERGFPT